MNNCLSGTMSSGANLLSIFVPSYFLTVTYYPKLWQTVFKVIMKHAAMRDTVHGHMPLRGFVCLLREIDIIIMHMLVKRLHVL